MPTQSGSCLQLDRSSLAGRVLLTWGLAILATTIGLAAAGVALPLETLAVAAAAIALGVAAA